MSYLGLADIQRAQPSLPLNALRRTGIVTTVNSNGTVVVNLGGDTTTPVTLPYLADYVPIVNDVVLILSADNDHIVVGSVSPLGKRLYRRYGTYSKSIPNNTFTVLTSITSVTEWSTLAVSPWSVAQFTVPFACWVDVHFQCDNLASTLTTRAFLAIQRIAFVGGATASIGRADRSNVPTSDMSTTAQDIWCVAGDVINFGIFQNSGAAATHTGFISISIK